LWRKNSAKSRTFTVLWSQIHIAASITVKSSSHGPSVIESGLGRQGLRTSSRDLCTENKTKTETLTVGVEILRKLDSSDVETRDVGLDNTRPVKCETKTLAQNTPFPQIDIIGAMVIDKRVRGKIIRSVLCNIVCNNCAQCNARTYEQT